MKPIPEKCPECGCTDTRTHYAHCSKAWSWIKERLHNPVITGHAIYTCGKCKRETCLPASICSYCGDPITAVRGVEFGIKERPCLH